LERAHATSIEALSTARHHLAGFLLRRGKIDSGVRILKIIEGNRAELLGAALTIWRPLGSFEQCIEWCLRPLIALGCCDPIERIERVKADDPSRRQIVELFEYWNRCHGGHSMKVAELAASVRAIIDPQRREHRIAARLTQLVGTRAGGFVMTRHPAGPGGVPVYTLHPSTFEKTSQPSGESYFMRGEAGAADKGAPRTCIRAAQPSVDKSQVTEEQTRNEAAALALGRAGTGKITIELGRDLKIHLDRDFDAEALDRRPRCPALEVMNAPPVVHTTAWTTSDCCWPVWSRNGRTALTALRHVLNQVHNRGCGTPTAGLSAGLFRPCPPPGSPRRFASPAHASIVAQRINCPSRIGQRGTPLVAILFSPEANLSPNHPDL